MTEAISSVQQLEDAVAAVLPNDPKAELFFTRSVLCSVCSSHCRSEGTCTCLSACRHGL